MSEEVSPGLLKKTIALIKWWATFIQMKKVSRVNKYPPFKKRSVRSPNIAVARVAPYSYCFRWLLTDMSESSATS